MKHVLISLAALACAAASAADFVAAPPLAAASAAVDPCVRVEVTTKVVNGKAMELRRKVRSQDPNCAQVKQSVRLWD